LQTNRKDRTGSVDLSVVIVNWNTCEELRKCLRSVMEAGYDGTETIVVDNASFDKSVEMVRREFPWVRLIQNSENLGFARACNRGIEASRGRYIFLLNSDTEVEKGAFPALVRFGDENPDVGIFGPKVLNPDGSLQCSCRRFPTLKAALFRYTPLGRLFPRNPYTSEYRLADWDHSHPRDVDWVSGAAMVVRREMLDAIGAFDAGFFMYCEDVDLGYRAKQADWRVAYYPGASVTHVIGRSSDRNANAMIVEFHRSMYHFFKKHYAGRSSILIRLIVPVALFAIPRAIIAHNQLRYLRFVLTYRAKRALRLVTREEEVAAADPGAEEHPNEGR